MRVGFLPLATLLLITSVSTGASAQTGASVGSNDGVGSGEAGARAGTVLTNQLNPDKPLPLSSGSVLQDTARNLGAGQKPGEAWTNAANSNAGVQPTNTPPKK